MPFCAALRYHVEASFASGGTPSPASYNVARLSCAWASPASAALRNHRAASAHVEHDAEIELRRDFALLGRFAKPLRRLHVVRRILLRVNVGGVILRPGMPLLRGFYVPFQRFGLAAPDAPALVVHHREIEL